MKVNPKHFRVKEGKKVNLKKWPTIIEPYYKSKSHYKLLKREQIEQLSALQSLLAASSSHSLLIILQGMDAAGKDSTIKHVMSGVNPQGCEVTSFKQPSAEELEHDFLWRTYLHLPRRGKIGIFNRSHYEEVLIVRVHTEYLGKEMLPINLIKDKQIWDKRYHSIVDFENHLHRNGTHIIKFFLHLSKKEQRNRFLARIDDANKNWKFNLADIRERKYWEQYRRAYEICLHETSTKNAPWYIIPGDDKSNAHVIISQVIIDTLKQLKLSYPKASKAHQKELKLIRKQLLK